MQRSRKNEIDRNGHAKPGKGQSDRMPSPKVNGHKANGQRAGQNKAQRDESSREQKTGPTGDQHAQTGTFKLPTAPLERYENAHD